MEEELKVKRPTFPFRFIGGFMIGFALALFSSSLYNLLASENSQPWLLWLTGGLTGGFIDAFDVFGKIGKLFNHREKN